MQPGSKRQKGKGYEGSIIKILKSSYKQEIFKKKMDKKNEDAKGKIKGAFKNLIESKN